MSRLDDVLAGLDALGAEQEWREQNPPWAESPWPGGHTHYACLWCAYGALARQDMEEHQAKSHQRELGTYGPASAGAEPTPEE